MAKSSTKRTNPKRSPTNDLTADQNRMFMVNLASETDWSTGITVFKNDYYNCRPVAKNGWNQKLICDAWGYPTDDTWGIVIQDGAISPRVTTPAGTEWAHGVLPVCRWLPNEIIKGRLYTRNDNDVFPIAAWFGCDIRNIKQDINNKQIWNFEIFTTWCSIGFNGVSGSKGYRKMILETKDYTIDDILKDEESLWTDAWLDYLKQFSGFRLMPSCSVNLEGNDTFYNPRRIIWNLRPKFSNPDFNPNSLLGSTNTNGFISSQPYLESVWLEDQGANYVFPSDIEYFVAYMNAIKNRPGSKLKKVWYNIMPEVAWGWDKKILYNQVWNTNTNTWVQTNEILAECDPKFSGFGEEHISNLADIMRLHLHPSLDVVFELSNETWNYTFKQAVGFFALSQTAIGNQAPYYFEYDGNSDANHRRARCMAYYATQMSIVTKRQFALSPERPLCETYMCGLHFSIGVTIETNIGYVEHITGKPFCETMDGIGVATYVGPNPANMLDLSDSETIKSWGDDHFFLLGRGTDGDSFQTKGSTYLNDLCVRHNVKHINYEGGIELNAFPPNKIYLLLEILLDPDQNKYVLPLYTEYYKRLRDLGVTEHYWYTCNPKYWSINSQTYNYHWTVSETPGDQKSIKYTGLIQSWKKSLEYKGDDMQHIIKYSMWSFPTVVGNTAPIKTLYTAASFDYPNWWSGILSGHPWYFGSVYPDNTINESNYPAAYGRWTGNPEWYYSAYCPEDGVYEFKVYGNGGTPLKRNNLYATVDEDVTPIIGPNQVNIGNTYLIYSTGDTNWVGMGAAANTVGTVFIATANGTGTGTCTDPFDCTINDLADGHTRLVLSTREYTPGIDGAWNEIGRYIPPGTDINRNISSGIPYKGSFSGFFKKGYHSFKINYVVPNNLLSQSGRLDIISLDNYYDRTIVKDKVNPVKTTSVSSVMRMSTPVNPLPTVLTYAVGTNLNFAVGDSIYAADLTSTDVNLWCYYGNVESYDANTGTLMMSAKNNYNFPSTDPITGAQVSGTTSSVWEIGHCFSAMGLSYGSGYSSANNLTVNIPAPDDPNGVQATAIVKTLDASGKINKIIMTNKGSGYYWPKIITITDSQYVPTLANTAVLVGGPSNTSRQPDTIHSVKSHTIGPAFTYIDKNYTYATNALGQVLYDAFGAPIILDSKNNAQAYMHSYIGITKLS